VRVRVGDVRLFFEVDGFKLVPEGPTMRERPTLVALHGGPGFDHSMLKNAFRPLADGVQVITFDQRGNGRSDHGDSAKWNLDQWADDVAGFCEALEIEKPVVLGQSFGSFVAMAFAIRHPDKPAKLILSSGAPRIDLDRARAMFERLGGAEALEVFNRYWDEPGDEQNFADYMRVCLPLYNPTPVSEEVIARVVMNRELMERFGLGELRTFDYRAELGKIRCPTLVLAGELDPITTVDDAEDIVAALPPELVRFERFPQAGHGVFRDQPDEALAVIREFILT
jgi:proline-specific peptidase